MATDLIPLTEVLPADRNPALVYLASLGANGRRPQQQALRVIVEIVAGDSSPSRSFTLALFPWHLLKYQHVAAIRAKLAERIDKPRAEGGIKLSTANRNLSALRGVLKECWRLEWMSAEDYNRAVDFKPLKGESLPAGRELSSGEISSLMNACMSDHSPAGTRDAAIIGLLYACGLRRAELVGLNVSDLDADKGKLIIRGKGNKERIAWVNNGAFDALTDWLSIRGNSEGPMFFPVNKGGHLITQRLTAQGVYNLLVKRGEEAGVENFSPHDFRRSFISDLLDKGADIATVSKMAGHANVQTTARYDRRPEEAKQKAAKLLHVPYRRKDGRTG